jgi:endo-1,4-beta-xylanase
VRRSSIQSITLIIGFGLSACNGADNGGGLSDAGGSTSLGGSAGSAGSPSIGGGVQVASGGATIGSLPVTSVVGGSPSAGGTVATGGAPQNGGATAAGGKATGGTSPVGSSVTTVGGSSSLPKFVGNITTGNGSVDTGGMKYNHYWNQITPENAGKWGSVQGSASGSFNWGTLDSIYSFTQSNNIIFKQHVFVWGSQQPSGTPTLAQVENWIKSFCTRFPNTKVIDVVNEPPPHTTPNYTANLGAGEGGTWPWITKAFKLARQYCPNAILVLNDYNNIEYADQETHFMDIVKDIKANGAPIDAVGCQAHGLKNMSTATLQANIDKMASGTGLPIYITEYDIGDTDQNQLTNFKNHFPVFLNTAAVKGITVWGWINGSTWISNSGLVSGTSPRPAMTWLMGQLNRPVPPN